MHTRLFFHSAAGPARRGRLFLAAVMAVAVTALCTMTTPVMAGELEWIFETTSSLELTDPPLPSYDIHLILDDDTPEGVFGVGFSAAQQFLWFNRFANPGPFVLEEIRVLFPAGANMAVGAEVQLAVYLDPDGDPTNGADLLATLTEVVKIVDGNTFSVYILAAPITIYDSGDILVGVVDRFVESGVTSPTTPAAMDTTASHGRSWLAVWTGDPPDPPLLPSDGIFSLVDVYQPGNWMIRAFGTPTQIPAVPAMDRRGLVLLVLLISAAGLVAARSLR